jgi:hypothetical protein
MRDILEEKQMESASVIGGYDEFKSEPGRE